MEALQKQQTKDFQKCLTVLKSNNYFPTDACNKNE